MPKEDSQGNQTRYSSPPIVLNDETEERTISLADALYIGTRLEFLRQTEKGEQSKSATKSQVTEVLSDLQELFHHRDFNTNVNPQISRLKSKIEEDDNFTNDITKEIVQKSTTWNHLLYQELKREQRIPVADTGLLDVESLLYSPEELFTPTVWDWLDSRPKNDIREACKTILIGCPTSSVMLSLRAVEHCLREWYEEEEDERLEAAWGQVLDQLMEKFTEEDKKNDTVLTQLSDLPPVLSNLYYLKEKRNEVSHPEDSPMPEEARRTLMIVASTITDIYAEMRGIALEEIKEQDRGVSTSTKEKVDFSRDISELEKKYLKEIHEISDMEDTDGITRDMIYDIGRNDGFSEEEIDDIIRELLMSGYIYEFGEDKFRPI